MQEPDNAEDLQDALQYRDNTEAAFDQLAASLGMNILKQAAAVSRGARTAGIPPEALEGIAQLLNGKGHIEDAQAQISRIRGYPELRCSMKRSETTTGGCATRSGRVVRESIDPSS
jgi:hypothetical protein